MLCENERVHLCFWSTLLSLCGVGFFFQGLLANGLDYMSVCEAVAFVMSLFAIITMLFSNLILALVNALAAFAMGVALDAGFSRLVSQTGNCR